MKLLIAFLTFAGTISTLLYSHMSAVEVAAQLAFPKLASHSPEPVPTPTPKRIVRKPIARPAVMIQPTPIVVAPTIEPTPLPTSVVTMAPFPGYPTTTPTATTSPSPMPSSLVQPLATATSTPLPTQQPTPTSGHLYYTSSHWKSKYYYCDTDKDWQSLSATYRKVFNSAEELLQAFPTRILHQPC